MFREQGRLRAGFYEALVRGGTGYGHTATARPTGRCCLGLDGRRNGRSARRRPRTGSSQVYSRKDEIAARVTLRRRFGGFGRLRAVRGYERILTVNGQPASVGAIRVKSHITRRRSAP